MAAPESGSVIVLGELPPHLVLMLQQIPIAEELSSADAEDRLFSEPSTDPELVADWKAYVQPELLESFRTARQVVESDLKRMLEMEGRRSLEIPLSHADAWLNALNQLRLAIAAAHHLSDEELSREEAPQAQTTRELAILRIHFYGYLQHVILDAMGAGE
ncbi:MAG TPA: DUF2017 family protein [Chthoniobacterales bacterium]